MRYFSGLRILELEEPEKTEILLKNITEYLKSDESGYAYEEEEEDIILSGCIRNLYFL